MDLSQILFNVSWITGLTSLATLIGLVTWWLVRKRERRVWLPTIRVLDMDPRRLPKLRTRTPPWIAFLCFLIAALAVLLFGLKPTEATFTSFSPSNTRQHVFVDLSPSVSSARSIQALAADMRSLAEQLQGKGQLTASLSSDGLVFDVSDPKDFEQKVLAAGFHRAGLKLGPALRKNLERAGDIDTLIIASDADRSTWLGFNWTYLQDEMMIYLYDLRAAKFELGNTYVANANSVSSPDSNRVMWQVRLQRAAVQKAVTGKVEALMDGTVLASSTYAIPADQPGVDIELSWSLTDAEQAKEFAVPHVVLHVVPDEADAIAMDNEYRILAKGSRKHAYVVGEPAGERQLDDPSHQLMTVLDVLGFKLTRVDWVKNQGPDANTYPLWIILAGQDARRYCPTSLESARLEQRKQQGARSLKRNMPIVWIAPQSEHVNWHDMCWCVSRLATGKEALTRPPEYCKEVNSRRTWVELLGSIGGKQIGGEVGRDVGSLAWLFKNRSSDYEVLAFTMPLQPSLGAGVTYARLPLMVRSLLQWQGLVAEAGVGALSWPQMEDVSEQLWVDKTTLTPDALFRLNQSNIHQGDSELEQLASNQLPPIWQEDLSQAAQAVATKKDQNDPKRLIWLCVALIVGALLLEILLTAGSRISKRMQRAAIWLPFLWLGWHGGDAATAQIQIVAIGDGASDSSVEGIAHEVAARTSIELNKSVRRYSRVDGKALAEPWLWVSSLNQISESGVFRSDLAAWLRRGGFLIVSAPVTRMQLDQLTGEQFEVGGLDSGWRVIPADHEIMRSFYLLDALPDCSSAPWYGFHFDGRLAILVVPFDFLNVLQTGDVPSCVQERLNREMATRMFINTLMVALATDYKKDQIHLPEILKRLR